MVSTRYLIESAGSRGCSPKKMGVDRVLKKYRSNVQSRLIQALVNRERLVDLPHPVTLAEGMGDSKVL